MHVNSSAEYGALGDRRRIRELEAEKDFGPCFIALARSIYQTNDKRAAVKIGSSVLRFPRR